MLKFQETEKSNEASTEAARKLNYAKSIKDATGTKLKESFKNDTFTDLLTDKYITDGYLKLGEDGVHTFQIPGEALYKGEEATDRILTVNKVSVKTKTGADTKQGTQKFGAVVNYDKMSASELIKEGLSDLLGD
jgi:hypothetical protein